VSLIEGENDEKKKPGKREKELKSRERGEEHEGLSQKGRAPLEKRGKRRVFFYGKVEDDYYRGEERDQYF